MRKRIVAGIIVLSVLGAAASYKLINLYRSCQVHFDENYLYVPAQPTWNGNREIMFLGLETRTKEFFATSGGLWATGVAKLGADVLILDTPPPRVCWFSDGGVTYKRTFFAVLRRLTVRANTAHGVPKKTIIAGTSFGGLHALVAYANAPQDFIGWQASMSVTKVNALEEFKSVGDMPAFNAFYIASKIRGTLGYISWGGKDMRVDHRLTEAFYSQIRSNKTIGQGFPNLDHKSPTLLTAGFLISDAARQFRFSTRP